MTPLLLVLLIGILLMTGFALDLARHESERADLQDALDRGVLAAASLSQSVDAETTVGDYLKNRSISPVYPEYAVRTDSEDGFRRVVAGAEYQMDTIFLRLAGLPQLRVAANSVAVHGLTPVEISLVLDISGTMRFNGRLINLRKAAKGFVDTVMAGGSDDVTTINLVPYAGQVNPGRVMYDLIGGRRNPSHWYRDIASCPELTDRDFASTHLPETGSYAQVPHFHHWQIDRVWMDWGWCPSDRMAITYLSNDADALKQKIDGIRLHDGTGTYNAMKWALALLDPSSQRAVADLAVEGVVDAAFTNRPAAWDDPETAKFIVLMTDGIIEVQNRPNDPQDTDLADEEVLVHRHPFTTTLSRAEGAELFFGLCDMAKQNGVTVFTIAFEVPEESMKNEMRTCASSLGHFYDVNGLEIESAFRQIATTIQNLKLVE